MHTGDVDGQEWLTHQRTPKCGCNFIMRSKYWALTDHLVIPIHQLCWQCQIRTVVRFCRLHTYCHAETTNFEKRTIVTVKTCLLPSATLDQLHILSRLDLYTLKNSSS
jgi:hypothetical protein